MTLASALAAAALSLSLGAAAQAQTPVNPPAAVAPQPGGGFTVDTPIETIAADPAGKAVLEKDTPGLLEHPMYDSFKSMSLKEVAPMSEGKITEGVLATTQSDLSAIKH